MTDLEFLASLPETIDLHGSGSPADVVVAIRRDLKAAVKAGLIPGHARFSVRRQDYKSIYVDLVEWHGQVLVEDYEATMRDHVLAHVLSKVGNGAFSCEPCPKSSKALPAFDWANMLLDQQRRTRRQSQDTRLIDAINDVMWLVERIADRHNYDRSDIRVAYFDVGFFLHLSAHKLIAAAERGIRLECDSAYGDLLGRARVAAKRVGAKVVQSICGAGGVENCSEWSLERLLKLDAEASGRPLAYDKRRGRWMIADEDGCSV